MHSMANKRMKKRKRVVILILILQIFIFLTYIFFRQPKPPTTPTPLDEKEFVINAPYAQDSLAYVNAYKKKDSEFGVWEWRRHIGNGELVNVTKNVYTRIGKKRCDTKDYSYSALNDEKLPLRRIIAKKASEQMHMKHGDSIFEVGTGCGAWLGDMKLFYDDLKVGGIDLSSSNIESVKGQNPEGEFYVEDIRNLRETSNKKWDHIYTWGVLQFLPTPGDICDAGLAMYDMLNQGGSMWIGLNEERTNCREGDFWGWIMLPDYFWETCFARIGVPVKYVPESAFFSEGIPEEHSTHFPLYCRDTDSIFIVKE